MDKVKNTFLILGAIASVSVIIGFLLGLAFTGVISLIKFHIGRIVIVGIVAACFGYALGFADYGDKNRERGER